MCLLSNVSRLIDEREFSLPSHLATEWRWPNGDGTLPRGIILSDLSILEIIVVAYKLVNELFVQSGEFHLHTSDALIFALKK